MKRVKAKAVSLATAALLMFGSAVMLPSNVLSDSMSITASAIMKNGTEGKCGANVRWTFSGGVLTLSGTGAMYDYENDEASPFARRQDVKKIVVNSGVTHIGKYAFSYMHHIESVSLPTTLTDIGDYAFFWCRNFKSLSLPKSVKKIGSYAFSRCSEFESVDLPEGLTAISDHAFNYTSITSLKLPSTLTEMGEYAFNYCTDIKGTVTIPGSLKTVPKSAFWNCTGIEKVVLQNGVAAILPSAFNGCSNLTSVTLPSTLTDIEGAAFADCKKLTGVSLPGSVKALGNGALRGTALQSITVPSSVTVMGDSVFESCGSLKKAVLPDSLTSIGSSTFKHCKVLNNVKLPANLKALPSETFYNCSELTDIALPSKLANIGVGAFKYCTKLRSVIIPDGVNLIDDNAFSSCSALRHVYMPKSLKGIGSRVFDCCTSLLYVNIPEGVTNIAAGAFNHCTSLNGIYLPTTLRTVGLAAFCGCTGVKNINVPANAVNISDYAFGYKYDAKNNSVKTSDFLLTCVNGSFGESYAKRNNLNYETVPANTIRLAGSNRYSTAVEISRTGIKRSRYVVLASGKDYADALAGVAYARSIGAPILLTDKNTISADTLAEIERLGAIKVYILGGTGAVSTNVENTLIKAGHTTERISGKSRFGTAAEAAKRLTNNNAPKKIFFVCYNNFADALSISTVAALEKAPIIYLKKDGSLDAETAAYLKSVKGKVANAYVIGGKGVISDSMMKTAADALGLTVNKTMKRIAGANRYKTCAAINREFASLFTGSDVCIATGADFPDALAGGAFAALKRSPLMLVKDLLFTEQTNYLKKLRINNKYVFGGKAVVPNSMVEKVAAAGK